MLHRTFSHSGTTQSHTEKSTSSLQSARGNDGKFERNRTDWRQRLRRAVCVVASLRSCWSPEQPSDSVWNWQDWIRLLSHEAGDSNSSSQRATSRSLTSRWDFHAVIAVNSWTQKLNFNAPVELAIDRKVEMSDPPNSISQLDFSGHFS